MPGHVGPPMAGPDPRTAQPSDKEQFLTRTGAALGVELALGLALVGLVGLVRRLRSRQVAPWRS